MLAAVQRRGGEILQAGNRIAAPLATLINDRPGFERLQAYLKRALRAQAQRPRCKPLAATAAC